MQACPYSVGRRIGLGIRAGIRAASPVGAAANLHGPAVTTASVRPAKIHAFYHGIFGRIPAISINDQ
jgi:hypothetical protein